MVIDKNIHEYVIFHEDSILTALQKISQNKSGIIFVTNERWKLEGILTDGDIRRYIINSKNLDINMKVSTIVNTNFVFAREGDSPESVKAKFNEQKNIRVIPVLDEQNHFIGIAKLQGNSLRIGNIEINETSPTFIIAEIGNNHNGDIKLAKELVRLAHEAGADCAKFQMRSLKSLYSNSGKSNDIKEDLGSQYVLDLLERFQLKDHELFEVFDYCKEIGIIPLCTAWDEDSLEKLDSYGLEAFKVASADLTNHDLLSAIMKKGKPLIVSTGMSLEEEIKESVSLLQNGGANFILLHCNSSYPAPFRDIHLNYMTKLKKLGNGLIGYSGHERGIAVSIGAVSMGAKLIEKHFTIDKSMEGNDHKVSLLPSEFKEMVAGIRQIEEALGKDEKTITQGEMINRETLAKSLMINRSLKAGEIITENMIDVKSPGKGLQPNKKNLLIGKVAKRDFNSGDLFFHSDLEDNIFQAKNYNFDRPWGLPVRYHDFQTIAKKTNLTLLEFHLSYKDLEEDLSKFFQKNTPLNYKLVIHAPELFKGDHLLNLCATDTEYRNRSIRELQNVIEVTRKLQSYFGQTNTPIVTNVGGYSSKGFLSSAEKNVLYANLVDSLKQLDRHDVEIIPQTMPPFPWHFGGQSFHNILVDPDEIADLCEKESLRICFDISHSQLACNYYKLSMTDFFKKIGKYTAHMHIADAKGVDGEGLQIDDGDMDFKLISNLINDFTPKKSSFIPEVWQGHKNEGEGFWKALELLERYSEA